MKRAFHVAMKEYRKSEKIMGSFDTYEEAVKVAHSLLDAAPDNAQLHIASQGVMVWGPYIKGGKYKP